MGWVAWHNEFGARRFGRVVGHGPGVVYAEQGSGKLELIAGKDLIAGAATLAKLDAEVQAHAETCHICKMASEALRLALQKVGA